VSELIDNLDSIAEQLRLALSAKDTAREKALPLCRGTIRQCSIAIRSVHRQEFARAAELLLIVSLATPGLSETRKKSLPKGELPSPW